MADSPRWSLGNGSPSSSTVTSNPDDGWHLIDTPPWKSDVTRRIRSIVCKPETVVARNHQSSPHSRDVRNSVDRFARHQKRNICYIQEKLQGKVDPIPIHSTGCSTEKRSPDSERSSPAPDLAIRKGRKDRYHSPASQTSHGSDLSRSSTGSSLIRQSRRSGYNSSTPRTSYGDRHRRSSPTPDLGWHDRYRSPTPRSEQREAKRLKLARRHSNVFNDSERKKIADDHKNKKLQLRGSTNESPQLDREATMQLKLIKKNNFKHIEWVNGRLMNVLEGLELYTNVFSAGDQKKIVSCVYDLQDMGRKGQLREHTYTAPRKWMRGKGRVTIQFGCCYNYTTDKHGNPPGIARYEEVDPLPPFLKEMIERMVEQQVLPPTCIPNSAIINIYDKDDCIPPHIDHHDFIRPFCTVLFLSECTILFGRELKILGAGEFSGSVLILSGNGADVAKHCVPAVVPAKRISITFKRMDDRKIPFKFKPDPELVNLQAGS